MPALLLVEFNLVKQWVPWVTHSSMIDPKVTALLGLLPGSTYRQLYHQGIYLQHEMIPKVCITVSYPKDVSDKLSWRVPPTTTKFTYCLYNLGMEGLKNPICLDPRRNSHLPKGNVPDRDGSCRKFQLTWRQYSLGAGSSPTWQKWLTPQLWNLISYGRHIPIQFMISTKYCIKTLHSVQHRRSQLKQQSSLHFIWNTHPNMSSID